MLQIGPVVPLIGGIENDFDKLWGNSRYNKNVFAYFSGDVSKSVGKIIKSLY